MFSKILSLVILLGSFQAHASWNGAKNEFERGRKDQRLKNIIIELADKGYYFSATPLMKEYLIRETKNLDARIERAFSQIIENVGIKQFETLPHRYLVRSKSDNVRFIIAKKYLRQKKYARAINYLKGISSTHSIYPFAKNMEGAIYAIQGQTLLAMNAFRVCQSTSASRISGKKARKYALNRDYCLAGLARAKFANRNYQESDLLYLDIPKSSMIWPEILFEEAWNSYYQKNYNRSLGKLVSYKAPVFQHIFNPEVEVLSALSYLKMCLYQDAKLVSNNFISDYEKQTQYLHRLLYKMGNRYNRYYDLMVRFEQFGKGPSKLVRKILNSISSEQVYRDMKLQLSLASNELDSIRSKPKSKFKNFVLRNLKEAIKSHRKIVGSFVAGKVKSYYFQMYRALEGMSYIKLEVLSQRKAKLYSFDETKRERGDIKYIQRNEKQYFWDFNGEFWADELGDYVFALKSEC